MLHIEYTHVYNVYMAFSLPLSVCVLVLICYWHEVKCVRACVNMSFGFVVDRMLSWCPIHYYYCLTTVLSQRREMEMEGKKISLNPIRFLMLTLRIFPVRIIIFRALNELRFHSKNQRFTTSASKCVPFICSIQTRTFCFHWLPASETSSLSSPLSLFYHHPVFTVWYHNISDLISNSAFCLLRLFRIPSPNLLWTQWQFEQDQQWTKP